MLDVRLLKESERQMTVCNACRYCEGVCAVFPALERRRTFAEGDIVFLGNLCHDCRACFDVCPFAPPHEFDINFPKLMSEVREQTYQAYSVPRFLARAFAHGSRTAATVTLLALAVLLTLAMTLSSDRLFQANTGPGSFYEIIPWLVMFIPALAVSLYGIAVIGVGVFRFWRDTGGPFAAKLDGRAFINATTDVLLLRQMHGGGPGCTYPDERPSFRRVVTHQLVFYGFILTFIATTLAAIAQEILGVLPPYPILGPVVLTGMVGGVMQVIGCFGLLALKLRASTVPASVVMRKLDFAFIALLLLVNLTGLALLTLRDTPAMGTLLVVHLSVVAGLFITMPYGKFVHWIYRYAALVRNRQEEVGEREASSASA